MPRPPLAAAREHATKELIKAHEAEHENLVDEYLARNGWQRQAVTTHKWVSGLRPGSPVQEDSLG